MVVVRVVERVVFVEWTAAAAGAVDMRCQGWLPKAQQSEHAWWIAEPAVPVGAGSAVAVAAAAEFGL